MNHAAVPPRPVSLSERHDTASVPIRDGTGKVLDESDRKIEVVFGWREGHLAEEGDGTRVSGVGVGRDGGLSRGSGDVEMRVLGDDRLSRLSLHASYGDLQVQEVVGVGFEGLGYRHPNGNLVRSHPLC